MIAYTAWDSLRAIAREQDGQLALLPGGGVAVAWCREPARTVATSPGLSERVRSLLVRFGWAG